MEYSVYRSRIKTGDLLAWSTHQAKGFHLLVNKLIRLFTMSEYSHVGVAWVIGDRIFIIEAVQPVVRIYPLSNEVPFYHVGMNLKINEDSFNYLLSRVGEPYSLWQAVSAYFGKPKADKQWQCAELVSSFYKRVGLNLKNSWTPSTLIAAVLSLNDEKHLTFVSR